MIGCKESLSRKDRPPDRQRETGFTLIEMLVSLVVLVAIIAIVFSVTQETSKAWTNTTGKIEGFRNARTAFDAMSRTLSQATLNTYYDYAYVNGGSLKFVPLGNSTLPTTYARNSDLQIISGQGATLLTGITGYSAVTHAIFFQAPLGQVSPANSSSLGDLDKLLNACGFYVVYGPDFATPTFLPGAPKRYRYRLIQFAQPSDNLSVYVAGNKGTSNWYLPFIQSDATAATAIPSTPPTSNFTLAENIIALIIEPKLSLKDEMAADATYGINTASTPLGTALAPNYAYDSSTPGQGGTLSASGASSRPMLNSLNQLPPVVQVTMVALDEASAMKLGNTTAAPNALLGLNATLFTEAKNFQADLQTLKDNLSATPGNAAQNKMKLNFRVFQTEVAIRGAKWTSN